MSLADWSPCERPAPASLEGRYARLELLDWAVHGDGLFEAVCGEANNSLWTYMPVGPFPDKDAFEQVLEFVRRKFEWETLVIRSASTGEILGMASYMRIRPEHGSVEVGCVTFGPKLKRTREATDAMYLMARHAFDDLGYRRYEWKCNNANEASRQAAERYGFSFEGVFRNDMVVKGQSRDTAWYSITDEEWRVAKEAFERWLSPNNFDGMGRQRLSLTAVRMSESSAK
ncbi:MAG: GNAT family protein [Pseudomonadota bacterium]